VIKVTRRRGWVAEGFAGAAVLGLAACCYATSVALHGNGFIAAFVGGLGFAATGRDAARFVPFVEETGALVSLLVWLLFGVIAVVPAVEGLTWQTAVYAVLSLTLIRMLPVAVALLGTGLGRATVAFVGWFGPRGLASVVFGLLALESLGQAAARPAVAVIAFTVLLSVVAHGLTAEPLARRYGARLSPAERSAGAGGLAPIPERRLTRRWHAARHPDAAGQGEGGSR
jgi:NhaP-type Na+/H+ or K+/H+ antiporter